MKKVKGLVLESTSGYVYLLTPEGEYLKVPSRGRVVTTGSEIEMEYAQPVKISRLLAVAASLVLIIALSFMVHLSMSREEAYLALDINPSLMLTLDKKAAVVKAEAFNPEGEQILLGLHLKGESAEKAVELILNEAFLQDYLSTDKGNAIYISLAAPENYVLSEGGLRLLAAEKAAGLEIDTYLKVKVIDVGRAAEALEKKVSLNSIILQDELMEKGIWEENVTPGEGPPFAPPVRMILERVGVENIFTENEFVAGRMAVDGKPGDPGPPPWAPGLQKQEIFQQQQGENERVTTPTSLVPVTVPLPEEAEGEEEEHEDTEQQERKPLLPIRKFRLGPP